MNTMRYEGFVRGAFSIKLNSIIDRSGDLGRLVEADVFRIVNNIITLMKLKLVQATQFQHITIKYLIVMLEFKMPIIQRIEEYITYRDRYFVFNCHIKKIYFS